MQKAGFEVVVMIRSHLAESSSGAPATIIHTRHAAPVASEPEPQQVLVLSDGIALGAFEAGAFEALEEMSEGGGPTGLPLPRSVL
jgi:hypothetical protein